jgi:hypothetical protein
MYRRQRVVLSAYALIELRRVIFSLSSYYVYCYYHGFLLYHVGSSSNRLRQAGGARDGNELNAPIGIFVVKHAKLNFSFLEIFVTQLEGC